MPLTAVTIKEKEEKVITSIAVVTGVFVLTIVIWQLVASYRIPESALASAPMDKG